MSKNLKVKLTIDADGNVKGVLDGVNKKVDQLDGKVRTADTSTKNLTQTVNKFGGIAAGAFAGLGLATLVSEVVDATKEFQSLNASLVTVTGSAYAADVAFEGIQEFAEKTPFSLAEVTQSFIKMKALGLDPSESALTSYGDTASAMGKSLNQMIEAVADASTGEFERLKEFGIKSSSQGDQVSFTFNGVTTTVKKNSAEIEQYLIKLGQTNFAGGMALQMETIGGQMANMEDAWQKAFNALGESSAPAISGTVSGMTGLANTVEDLSEYLDDVAYLSILGLGAALTRKAIPAMYGMMTSTVAASAANVGFIATTKAATAAAWAFAATPLGAAVTAVAVGVAYLTLREDEATTAKKDLTKAARELNVELSNADMDKRSKQLVEYRQELDALKSAKKQNASIDVLGIKQSDLEKRIVELTTFKDVLKDTLKLVRGSIELDLAGEYAQINEAMLSEREALSKKLFDLTATEAQKREKILNSIDAENIGLQKSIWAVQDKATAQKEYNKLLVEQNKEIDLSLNAAIATQKAMEQAWGQKQNDAYDQRTKNQWDQDTEEFDVAEQQASLLSETLEMASNVDLIGDAWTRTGDKALDAMGSMATVLAKTNAQEVTFAKQQAKLDQTKWADQEDYVKASMKLDDARVKSSLKGSLTMLDASVAMFEQGSDAQQMAHQASLVFHAIEMAMNIEKAISAATVAVAEQGKGDPYTAWARIGAMSVMMAGLVSQLGGSFGGASGSSPSVNSLASPDGSPLGSSDQSESVSNVFDLYQDIQTDQYSELRSINKEMQSLNSNLTGFVSSLYRTGDLSGLAGSYQGSYKSNSPFDRLIDTQNSALNVLTPLFAPINDMVGGLLKNVGASIFGSTKKSVSDYGLNFGQFDLGDDLDLGSYSTIKKKTDGGWFGKSRTSYSTQYSDIAGESERLLNVVFDNLRDGTIELGEQLGIDVQSQVDDFTIRIGNISTLNKSGDEISAEISAALSQQSDNLAYAIFDDLIIAYSDLNEGAFETVNRLVAEKAVVADILDMTNKKMTGDAIALSQSLIDIAGGLDALNDSASNYFDAFFSETEKAQRNQDYLIDSMSSLNIALPRSSEEFRAMVEGTELSTESNKEAYVALLKLSESAADYYKFLEKQELDRANNTQAINQILSATNQTMSSDAINAVLSLDNVSSALSGISDSASTFYDLFYSDTEKQVKNDDYFISEMNDLNMALPASKDGFKDLVEGIELTTMANGEAYSGLLDLSKAADSYYSNIKKQQQEALELQISNSEQAVQGYQSVKNALESAFDAINGGSGVNQMSYMDAQKVLFDQVEMGTAPSLTTISDALKVVSNNSTDNYATLSQYERDQQFASDAITTLIDYTNSAMSIEDSMLSELQMQTDALNTMANIKVVERPVAEIRTQTLSMSSSINLAKTDSANEKLLLEIVALKNEVKEMKDQAYRMGLESNKTSAKTSRVLTRWDKAGQPLPREL